MKTYALVRTASDERRMKTYALLRVSTTEQDVAVQRLQIDRWAEAQDPPREVEYTEESGVSGVAKERPGLDAVVAKVRRGDELVVAALDRLGRSLVAVVMLLEGLRVRGVRVVSLRESLDLGTAAGRFQAQVICAFAELERELIRERTRAGLDAARKHGTRTGNPIGQPPAEFGNIEGEKLEELRAMGKSWKKIADEGFPLLRASGKSRRASAWTLRNCYERWERERAAGSVSA